MKVELLFPPAWDVLGTVYPALPLLTGFLRDKGISASPRDINIEVSNAMLSKEYLQIVKKKNDQQIKDIKTNNADSAEDIGRLEELIISSKLTDFIIDLIEPAKNALRSKVTDASPIKRYIRILEAAGEVISAPYYPSKWSILSSNYISRYTEGALTLENVYRSVFNDKENIFLDFFREQVVPSLMREQERIVGISLACHGQLIPGLTLARTIKEVHPKVHLTIGGPMLPYLEGAIFAFPEIFNLIDSAVVGDGELALRDLVYQLDENKNFGAVPNLIYRSKEGDVKWSQYKAVTGSKHHITPDFTDYDLNLYFRSPILLPYLTARGCYWNKCAFCSLNSSYGNSYRPLTVEKVVEDLKKLKEKYQCECFEFVDCVFSPIRLKELSQKIINSDLQIYWDVLARFEPEFSSELFHLAFQAGCRLFSWGLESGSQRVLDKMEKGINILNVASILQQSHEAGIWNNVFVMICFPGETEADFYKSLEFVIQNAEFIDSLEHTWFRLERCSKAFDNPSKYGISIDDYAASTCSLDYKYHSVKGMKHAKKIEMFNLFDTETLHLHCHIKNIGGFEGTRIIVFLRYNPKSEFRKMQKKEASKAVRIHQAFKKPNAWKFAVKEKTLWSKRFSLPTHHKDLRFQSGFDPTTNTYVVLPEVFVYYLNKSHTLGELENGISKDKNFTTLFFVVDRFALGFFREMISTLLKRLIELDFLESLHYHSRLKCAIDSGNFESL